MTHETIKQNGLFEKNNNIGKPLGFYYDSY